MARIQMTNGELLTLRNEITNAENRSIVFKYFQQEKINRFANANKVILSTLQQKMDELVKNNVKHDDAGKITTEMKPDDMAQVPTTIKKPFWPWNRAKVVQTAPAPITEQYVFKSQIHEKRYLEQINEFMARTVTVEI